MYIASICLHFSEHTLWALGRIHLALQGHLRNTLVHVSLRWLRGIAFCF